MRSSKMSEERLDEAAALLDAGVELEREVVGGELKRVREYTEQLEREGNKWKVLARERIKLLKNAVRKAKSVAIGEIVITADLSSKDEKSNNSISGYSPASPRDQIDQMINVDIKQIFEVFPNRGNSRKLRSLW